jgi:virulence-associated protein VapD
VTQQYDDIREIVKKQHIEHIKNKIYETVHGSNQMNDFYEKLHALLKESNVFDVRELSIGLYDE